MSRKITFINKAMQRLLVIFFLWFGLTPIFGLDHTNKALIADEPTIEGNNIGFQFNQWNNGTSHILDYQLSTNVNVSNVSWSITSGSIEPYTSTNNWHGAKVKFTGSASTVTITAVLDFKGPPDFNTKRITISKTVSIIFSPNTIPPKPQQGTRTCGNTVVNRVGTPTGPNNERWYLQSSKSGKSTYYGYGSTYNVSTSGTYYVRSWNSAGWGPEPTSGTYISVALPTIAGYIDGAKDGLDRVETELELKGYRGNQLTWKKNGSTVGTSSNKYQVNTTESANYEVVVKNDICPAKTTDHVNIDIYKSPVISVADGLGGRKILSTGNHKSFQWMLNGNDINGATSSTYVAQESGSYQVRVVVKILEEVATSDPVDLSLNVINIMPSNPNYIRTQTITEAGIKSVNEIDNTNADVSTTYIDRLGRTVQTVQKSSSPLGYDIVQHQEYNVYGQATKSYLSHVTTTNTGAYDQNAASRQSTFYNSVGQADTDSKPWSEVKVEKSPAQRVLESGGLGEGYQLDDYASKYEYTFNTTADAVINWSVDASGELITENLSYFSANQLRKEVVKSPEWTSGKNHTNESYTNSLGQKILTRSFLEGEALDTYYVYDNFGQLIYVLPPEAVVFAQENPVYEVMDPNRVFQFSGTFPADSATNKVYYLLKGKTMTIEEGITLESGFELSAMSEYMVLEGADPFPSFDQLIFKNVYSSKGELIEKHVPGADPVYYVYDAAGRLRFSQDGEQRKVGQWTFTKYDQLGRPVLTGVYTFDHPRTYMQQQVLAVGDAGVYEERGTALHGYTDNLWPTNVAENEYLVVSYYDDYGFMDGAWNDMAYDVSNTVNNDPYKTYPRGLETGGKVRILNSTDWLRSVKYYDDDLQLIQGVSDHHRGKLEKVYTQYNWLGEVVKTRFEHQVSETKTVSMEERFVYDAHGRLMEQYHSTDNEPEILIGTYSYNELGELIEKNLHKQSDNTFVQSIDYRYNIRGQLTHINQSNRTPMTGDTDDHPDRFGMELYYDNSPTGLSFDTQTDGMLAGTTWGHAAMTESDERSYAYSYDQINRLTGATYKEKKGTSWNVNVNHNNVSDIKYDLNGNIQTLKRTQSNTLIDDLEYEYEGNRLWRLDDNTDNDLGFKDGAELEMEYQYDANGNMISDANKLITSISYNMLNKPETITFTNGDHIDYTYDAAGTRLSMSVTTGGDTYVTDYSSGLIYEDNELITISMPQGRILVERVGVDYNYDYQYYLTDHLGNTRAMVAPTSRTYQATMESESATTEEAQFLNVDASRQLDATNARSGDESAWLNPKYNRIIGPAKAMKVYKGDQVNATVWAKYTDIVDASPSGATMLVADAITTAFGVSSGELYNALSDAFSGASLLAPGGDLVPMAYLNYTFFDKNYENPQSGLVKIGTASRNTYAQLERDITAPDDGFLLVWVSNETDRDANVFFDDMEIVHTSAANVYQADDYYPFGLPIASSKYLDVGNTENRFLYQGKEWQTQLALNLFDFHARQYDPATGRFTGVDPQNQFASGYVGMGNMPTVGVDPDGEFLVPFLIGAAISVATNGVGNLVNDQGFFDNVGTAALIGGIGGVASFGIGQAANSLSGLGKAAFQAYAHGFLGGTMSHFSGGSFESGFLSGALASGASSALGGAMKGVESNFAKSAASIGTGTIMGGIGSEIAGGDFWDGARNGAISSTLNHGVHSGWFGKGIMMSAITGRTRHLFMADAYSFEGTADVGFGGTIAKEAGGLLITRGDDKGLHYIEDTGGGILTDISASTGIEVSEYYYTGPAHKLHLGTFEGYRTEVNLNGTVLPVISAGLTGSYAVVDQGLNRVYSLGVTVSAGVSALEFLPATLGINYGYTKVKR